MQKAQRKKNKYLLIYPVRVLQLSAQVLGLKPAAARCHWVDPPPLRSWPFSLRAVLIVCVGRLLLKCLWSSDISAWSRALDSEPGPDARRAYLTWLWLCTASRPFSGLCGQLVKKNVDSGRRMFSPSSSLAALGLLFWILKFRFHCRPRPWRCCFRFSHI